MSAYRLRILHLSDLHERVPGLGDPRKKKTTYQAAQRYRVLEDAFEKALAKIRAKGPIDLVCFTGDVADFGLPKEYKAATARIKKILNAVGVGPERFFVVPGNHDVQRNKATAAWKKLRTLAAAEPEAVSRWMAGGKPPRAVKAVLADEIQERTAAFWKWVQKDLGRASLKPGKMHPRLGYRETLDGLGFPFPVFIIGLDSAWLAGDDADANKLRLTTGQIDSLTRDKSGKPLTGFRLALVHHPLSDLADAAEAKRLLADTVHLVLHGHQHDPIAEEHRDPDRRLDVLAAGSLFEGDEGERWLNSFHVVEAHLDNDGRPERYEIDFWGWSKNGHWAEAGAIYEKAPHGHLTWDLHSQRSTRVESHTSIVLDRIKQWTLLREACQIGGPDHRIFLLHGAVDQDLRLFMTRIERYLAEQAGRTHTVVRVERSQDHSVARTVDDWERCLIGGTRAKKGTLGFVLVHEVEQHPALVLFMDHAGPLRNLDAMSLQGIVALFLEKVHPLLLAFAGKFKQALRIVIPLEHRRGGDSNVETLREVLKQATALKVEVLPELSFPTEDEVLSYVREAYPNADAEILDTCRKIYANVKNGSRGTMNDLGNAVHEAVTAWANNKFYGL